MKLAMRMLEQNQDSSDNEDDPPENQNMALAALLRANKNAGSKVKTEKYKSLYQEAEEDAHNFGNLLYKSK